MSAPSALLSNKTAIITGGTRGIGAGISLEFARRGANLAMIYQNPATLPSATAYAAQLSTDFNIHAVAICCDLSQAASIASVVEQTLSLLKTSSIDIVVNNAALGDWTATEAISLERYEAVMNTNVRGPLFLLQAALPHMPRGGRIINISSFATRAINMGAGVPPMSLYIASKIALEGLTTGWAVEFGHSRGITANSVSVGMVETELIGTMSEEVKAVLRTENAKKVAAAPRSGTPDDVAQVVAFLAGEGSRWVTGSTVSANGGTIVI